jgi:hypothetical protein
MNSIRLFHLFLVLTVSFFQAPRLTAQSDRGPALRNVPVLIQNLADTKPIKRQVERTFSSEYFPTYSMAIDHVQGMTRLPDGRYVFSHSTNPNQKGLAVFARHNADAVYKPFSLNETQRQSHPSAMQACGNIVAVPTSDDVSSVHFFDASDPDNIIELTHLTVSYYESPSKPLNEGIDAAGLVYSEVDQVHYLTVSKGREQGREDGPVWLYKSNGLPLTDPNCRFTYTDGNWYFTTLTSASAFNLLYDEDGSLYTACMYRTVPGGDERLRLSKINYTANGVSSVDQISDILLSESGDPVSPSPGFRWGGGIGINGPNSIEVFASARVLTGGVGANHCVIKIWKGPGFLEDCRNFSDVSWLTSHNAFSAPSYGYPADNNQSLDLNGQIAGGARAFTLEAWEKANLNAPSGGPAYNNLKDAMEAGKVYLLNNPRRQPGVGGLLPGVNWPNDLDDNLPKARFAAWLDTLGQYLLSNPTEIVTLILEGDASFEAYSNSLAELNGEILDLFMNQSDYDNLYFRTLGDMRSSGRRLVVLRDGETLDFNINGRSFQFRNRFEKTVENETGLLPNNQNSCAKRSESAPLNTPERLVVFNHWGQTYHNVIVRRWLDHCGGVDIPNFLVVNNVTDGSLGVQPMVAVNEFNRRINDRVNINSARYRILVAGSVWNITQQSDEDDANAVTSNNLAEWDFILNSDKSYLIRLKDTNRYLKAPQTGSGNCEMTTDPDTERARWYVEPLQSGVIRLFSQHSYTIGGRRAIRQDGNGAAVKLSDNLDFVDINDQKFELLPVSFLNATCKPATLVLDVNGEAILLPEAIKNQVNYSGVCQAELFVTADKDFFDCADVGTHQVTLTVSNGADLNTSCTANVTVIDNTQTILECPSAQIISANNICKGTVGSWSPTRLEDNCAENLTVTQSPAAIWALNGHNDSELVTLTANDGHGNSSQCSFTVTLKDNTGPVITCKNATTHLDNSGVAVIGYGLVYVSGSDNCGDVNLESISKTLFRCADLGPNTVTVTANDGNGNIGTCTSIVTVVDKVAPNVVCKTYNAYLDETGTTSILPSYVRQSSSDNCSEVNLVSVIPNTFNCSHLGENTVTLTVNDGNDNTATCNATVIVVDDIAPTVVCKPFTAYLDNLGAVNLTPNDVFQSGADNCGTVNPASVAPNVLNCSNLGANTVTLTVNDGNNNTATCTASVTVIDNIAPTVVCKPFTAYLDHLGTVNIVSNDVFQSGADNCGTVNLASVLPNTFNCSNLGSNTVTLTVNDGHNNATTCTATVTVVDNIAPTVVCKPFTAYLNNLGTVNFTPNDVFQSGADNCGTVNPASVLPNTFNCSNLGANTVTLTVNDGNSNTTTCTATVTVVDNIAPTVVCKPFTAYLNNMGTVNFTPNDVFQSGADNCGTVNLAAVLPNAFNCSNLGANMVTLTVNDGNSNTATCTATVTVVDNIAPTVFCKTFTAFLNAAGAVSITPADVFQSGADNCGSVNLGAVSPSSFTCAQLGSNPVTLTVNDGNGNGASCNTFVTVKDAIKPTMLCKNATVYLNSAGLATLTIAQVDNSSFDNCGITFMSLSQTQYSCAHLGQNTVTLGGMDQSQNRGQCTATVTVLDAIVPVTKCKNITANLKVDGTVAVAIHATDNGSFDNCSFTQSLTPNTFGCGNVGPNNVTLRSTDVSGNTSTCTAIVTVKDVNAPNALCKNATIYVNDSGNATLNTSHLNNGSSDACGIASMTLSKTQFNCSDLPGSSQTVTLTLKDVNNNTSSCNAQVTTRDNIAPTAFCENTTVELGENGMVTVYPQDLTLDSYDNCSGWSYSPAAKVYTSANLGNNNLTITVKDWSGNGATCVSVITVLPNNGNNNLQQPVRGTEKGFGVGLELALFPNPTQGDATLAFALPNEQPYQIRVFDVAGRMIFSHDGSGLEGENTLPIRLGGIASGVYQLDFYSAGLKGRKRLVVME